MSEARLATVPDDRVLRLRPEPADAAAPSAPASAVLPADDLLSAWGLLQEATVSVRGSLAAGLERGGLSAGEFDVLVRLHREHTHRLPMTRVAHDTGMTSGGFTKLADRMEGHRLIRREPSPSDRRVIYAALTEHGAAVTNSVMNRHLADLREHLEHVIGPVQLLELAHLCRQLRDAHQPDHRRIG